MTRCWVTCIPDITLTRWLCKVWFTLKPLIDPYWPEHSADVAAFSVLCLWSHTVIIPGWTQDPYVGKLMLQRFHNDLSVYWFKISIQGSTWFHLTFATTPGSINYLSLTAEEPAEMLKTTFLTSYKDETITMRLSTTGKRSGKTYKHIMSPWKQNKTW